MYIKVGNRVYRQTIGIPMGTNCAPQLANLFLFHYEYSYMKGLMRDNLCIAKRFSDTVRYIDDLLTLNKMNKEVRMLLPKKDLIQVEYIGKINNYYEDIYIPPYNNTD